MSKEITLTGFMCDKCGKIFATGNKQSDKYLADNCCKQYYCEDCGKPLPKYQYVCDSCLDKRRFEKATKMSYSEYIKEYPDYPIYYDEEFYWELEDFLDYCKSEDIPIPEFVYGTYKEPVEIDIESTIQETEENSDIEDFYFENTQELIDFVNDWNKENGTACYYQDIMTCIVLTPEEKGLNGNN